MNDALEPRIPIRSCGRGTINSLTLPPTLGLAPIVLPCPGGRGWGWDGARVAWDESTDDTGRAKERCAQGWSVLKPERDANTRQDGADCGEEQGRSGMRW
jgi:hypothetical protein